MPEGPETKLTTKYLHNCLDGKIITNWEFIESNPKDPYLNEDPKGFGEFIDELPLIVDEVGCKGKLIYICCYNEFRRFYILHSMRTTGSWREKPDEYSRWFIEIEGKKIWFRDIDCFATLHFTENEDEFQNILNKLGPDIMSNEFTLPVWRQIIAKHQNKNVTAFLMDQEIISGCGNYIKSEALYYAKILPTRKMSSLTENELEKLFEALRIISRTAYMHKGLSSHDYADPKGRKGFQEFQLKIYGQKHAKKAKTADGRTTYWSEIEQK